MNEINLVFPNPWVDQAALTLLDMKTLLKYDKYAGVHDSIWSSP